jgi:nucleoside-diphosphate-sugar epimerase
MAPEDYQQFPTVWDDASKRRWNLWGYIDQRDVAQACRKALEADAAKIQGSPAFIIAAADTVMNRPSAELLAEVYPQVKLTRDVGEHGTLLAIDRAREVLGFSPAHSWRDHVQP